MSGMAQVQPGKAAGQPTSESSGGWRAVAAVTLLAGAAAVHIAWIIGSGLEGPSGALVGRLLDRLGVLTVVVGALTAGAAGAFLLYTTRWQATPEGSSLAGSERRRDLAARVLLSVAVTAMLVAIPAHSLFYLLAGPARDCEFCGLVAFALVFAAGMLALVTGLVGLSLARADPYLSLRVGLALGFLTIVEPFLTNGWMAVPAVGVVLNTAGIVGLLTAVVWLVRACPGRPRSPREGSSAKSPGSGQGDGAHADRDTNGSAESLGRPRTT
jgi:hypothetical protein